MRFFRIAAMKAVSAPMAELSTRLVQPLTNGTIIAANIASGSNPARSKRSFSAMPTSLDSALSAGPSEGLMRQRMAI